MGPGGHPESWGSHMWPPQPSECLLRLSEGIKSSLPVFDQNQFDYFQPLEGLRRPSEGKNNNFRFSAGNQK